MININHHGAINGVTGSCHELSLGSASHKAGILVDCGLFQGAEASNNDSLDPDYNPLTIEFPIEHIRALIVTHVHIDHVGRIPYLLAAGFKGPIYCTEASAQLLPLVLEDAVKIGITRDKKLLSKFLKHLKSRIQAVPYKQWQRVISEDIDGSPCQLDIKFQPAGHILGSAYVETRCRTEKKLSAVSSKLSAKESSPLLSADADNPAPSTNSLQLKANSVSQREFRVLFSGDLGAPHAPLLPAPKAPYKTDTLIIESTYGDKNHQGRKERRQQLKAIIERSLTNGGALLIPAFSIGRTQEILYELEGLLQEKEQRLADKEKSLAVSSKLLANDLKLTTNSYLVIVDSPLAANFTREYRKLKRFWDKEALGRVKSGRHPLNFEQLHTVDSHTQHIEVVNHLKQTAEPCIVIAASGMCAGGRMTNYLKALIEDERTDILFVGYQAAGTPGRDIQRYGNTDAGYVILDGEKHNINAKIHTISGYSAHADQSDLLNFIGRMRHKPSQIRVVHGDEDAKRALKAKILERWSAIDVEIP